MKQLITAVLVALGLMVPAQAKEPKGAGKSAVIVHPALACTGVFHLTELARYQNDGPGALQHALQKIEDGDCFVIESGTHIVLEMKDYGFAVFRYGNLQLWTFEGWVAEE